MNRLQERAIELSSCAAAAAFFAGTAVAQVDWIEVARGGNAPAPRAFASMAFDSDRGRAVLFGGQGQRKA